MPHHPARLTVAALPFVAGVVVTAVLAVPSAATAAPAGLRGPVTASSPRFRPQPSARTGPVVRPTPTAASSPSPTPTASPSAYVTRSDWAVAVLTTLNQERAAHGLPALSSSTRLVTAAHAHNLRMAQANTLSHQLPGEADLGSRVTATGYTWSTVGENVAWSSVRTQAGVVALQDAMYSETPPDDGHRRNILSTTFTQVGVDVIDDAAHRRVWLVTDFGRPR